MIVAGFLSADPETRYLPSGGAVTSFSIPTERKWKDKNTGQDQSETEWHNCTVFGKRADVIAKYCVKGSAIQVEGRIKTEKWTDNNGNERQGHKLIVEDFTLLGGRSNDSAPPQQGQQRQNGYQQQGGGYQQNNHGFDDGDPGF